MIRPFAPADTEPVVEVWHQAGLIRPWNDPYEDIARMTAAGNGLFLVADDRGDVVGTVMAGYDGHRGWIYYLAVVPDRQGSGIGRALLESAERHLLSLGCPKINLQIRADNPDALGFYERLGYRLDAVTSLGKRLG